MLGFKFSLARDKHFKYTLEYKMTRYTSDEIILCVSLRSEPGFDRDLHLEQCHHAAPPIYPFLQKLPSTHSVPEPFSPVSGDREYIIT